MGRGEGTSLDPPPTGHCKAELQSLNRVPGASAWAPGASPGHPTLLPGCGLPGTQEQGQSPALAGALRGQEPSVAQLRTAPGTPCSNLHLLFQSSGLPEATEDPPDWLSVPETA